MIFQLEQLKTERRREITYTAQKLAVLMLAAGGVYMDLKSEKVSNRWILLGLCLGVLWEIWRYGFAGILHFLLGSILPLALLYGLFSFRVLGAGDLKLLAAIGGFLGAGQILLCMIYTFCSGACLALLILIVRRNLVKRLHYFFQYIQRYIQTGETIPYGKPGMQPEHFHFTVAVFLGVLFWLGGGW